LIGSCHAVRSTTAQFKILLFFVFEIGLFSHPRDPCMQSTNMVTALLESGDLHTAFRTSMLLSYHEILLDDGFQPLQ
jgi:hypothetical protein